MGNQIGSATSGARSVTCPDSDQSLKRSAFDEDSETVQQIDDCSGIQTSDFVIARLILRHT